MSLELDDLQSMHMFSATHEKADFHPQKCERFHGNERLGGKSMLDVSFWLMIC